MAARDYMPDRDFLPSENPVLRWFLWKLIERIQHLERKVSELEHRQPV